MYAAMVLPATTGVSGVDRNGEATDDTVDDMLVS